MKLRRNEMVTDVSKTTSVVQRLPPQVLIVDDSTEVRGFIGELVKLYGFRVLTAEDGVVAQSILSRENPVLVISDLEMPNCDGWDVLVYCHAERPHIPVLIVSGTKLGQRPEIESWAAGYLPKPFPLEQFHAEIQRLVFQAA